MKEFDVKKPERILSKFLKANNIDYLLLRPEFENYFNNTGKDLYECHFNTNGHALVAELIYKKLKENHIVPFKMEMYRDNWKDNIYTLYFLSKR